MSIWEVLAIAVGLAMDAAAVSLGAAAANHARDSRATFRLAFHFGLFQFMMPVAGWAAGATVAGRIAATDHWVAFALLAFVGGRMVWAGVKTDGQESYSRDPSRGITLVLLSVATSIDALAVGWTLAMLGARIWYAAVIIGVVTATLSVLAIRLGNRLGATVGRRMEVAGGLILLLIGARILGQHLGVLS
ncbi:MAG: manganese efflux pump [Acidobacteria bacterium]|nr:MAG: manganese efflux pump [Acidobacteriota bacterium]